MPELLFSGAVLVEDDLIGLPDRLGGEQAVHALERNALGFGDEEEDEEDGCDHHRGEEEVHATSGGAHGVEHGGGEAGDEEVPEPIARCCGSLAETASVVVEDFTVDDPGRTVPRRRVEDGPQVEEEDRGDAARGQRGGGVRVDTGMENVTADDPHAHRTADGTDHQQLSASEVVDKDQDPDDGEYSLDHTEDTRGQEGGASAADTNRGENLG